MALRTWVTASVKALSVRVVTRGLPSVTARGVRQWWGTLVRVLPSVTGGRMRLVSFG